MNVYLFFQENNLQRIIFQIEKIQPFFSIVCQHHAGWIVVNWSHCKFIKHKRWNKSLKNLFCNFILFFSISNILKITRFISSFKSSFFIIFYSAEVTCTCYCDSGSQLFGITWKKVFCSGHMGREKGLEEEEENKKSAVTFFLSPTGMHLPTT